MNSMKTIPLLLLTFAVYNPCVHAAPAVSPPGSPNPGDGDFTPVTDPAGAPTITPFFTPAVFLPDYYSQPAPTSVVVAAVSEGDPTDFAQGSVPAPASDPITTAEPVEAAPVSTSPVIESPSTTGDVTSEPTLLDNAQATSTLTGDPAGTTNTPESTVTPSPASENVPLIFTISSESVTPSTPAAQLNSVTPTSTIIPASLNPLHSATPSPTGKARVSESGSSQTEMSRKAAVIGTILAVSSLLGISACAFCMHCVPRRLKKHSAHDTVEPFDPSSKDPEKVLTDKRSTTPTSSQQGSIITLPLPSLVFDAPSLGPQPSLPQDSTQSTQQRLAWQTHPATSDRNASGDFEDVTHILSVNTFAPLSGSERSSAASEVSDASLNRASNGAASVKAASYATCESRYSNTSAGSNVGESGSQLDSSDGNASTEYMSVSPSGTPSPPESPILRTPKQGVVTVTRIRSQTLTQPQSPRIRSAMSASKSFPARFSNRMSDVEAVLEEDSEWDIAADYGARYSKGSVGVRSTISEFPEERHEHLPGGEHMETIDIGGRHVIMVTGYAF